MLPDPDSSEIVWPLQFRLLEAMDAHPVWIPPRSLFRSLRTLLTLADGRTRFSRRPEPA
jgi:hypothetical protein